MERWKCVSIGDGTWNFKLNKVYNLLENGTISDKGARASPFEYNAAAEEDESVPFFIKVPRQLENK